ncbi:DndE family protein [Exiguobacterium sp. AB2]|uniref:DndE family protein n=1 Tax=Exiguobacterium sp. AB2 TaxID=1484479 RepID=UPI0004A9220F|nr:DndE family protein [Exiguobacterium sp. AB2]KDN57097.1 hypothetical protein DI14_00915 [Exiguobacterium sp. AB2]
MNYRLKLTEQTHLYLKEISNSTHITPNILARFAIGISLKNKQAPSSIKGLTISNFEINRATLTGEHDEMFKMMILQHANKHIEEDQYFPDYFNAHITRGAEELYQIFQFSRSTNQFLRELLALQEA